MDKKIRNTLCSLLLVSVVLTGCNKASPSDLMKNMTDENKEITSTEDPSAVKDNDYAKVPENPDKDPDLYINVTDLSGKTLAAIESAESGMIVPDMGVFYLCNDEYRLTKVNKDGKQEDIILGSAKDYSYETFYARTCIGDKLYTLAIKGDLYDQKEDQLYLLEFDLKEGKKNEYLISDNGFPYASLTSFNENVVLFFHDQKDSLTDRIIEFDTATKEIREVTTYRLDNGLVGESVRSLYADRDNLYVLKAIYKGTTDISMAVDVLDSGYKKTKEYDITVPMLKAVNDCTNMEDLNELIQAVSSFNIIDGRYLYYENFSVSRAFIDLKDSSVLYGIPEPFTSSSGNGPKVFYSVFCSASKDTIDPRAIYIFEKGELKKIPTAILDDGQQLSSVSASPDGNYMFTICGKDNKIIMTKIVTSSELR